MDGAMVNRGGRATARRRLCGLVQKDTPVIDHPRASHFVGRPKEADHRPFFLYTDVRGLARWVPDELSCFLTKKVPLPLRKIFHYPVTVRIEAVDFGRSDNAPSTTSRGPAVLQHHVANEMGREDTAIDQDAVELDEALREALQSRAVLAEGL
jgi:hypothetical protein